MKMTLLCLHGWGGSRHSFTELREALDGTDIEILTPDLPGFGDEPDPKKPWTNDDYANWVIEWFHNQKLETKNQKLFLLGHSHGGRISIKIASQNLLPVDHLFLCAAAGIRRPRHFKRITGLILAKVGNALFSIPGLRHLHSFARKMLYKLVRVHDYERATPVMQQTLINVSKEDLRPLLSSIETPTDIFWGEEDGMTPIGDAYIIHEKIPRSELHTFEAVRHRVHRDRANDIATVIQTRLASYP